MFKDKHLNHVEQHDETPDKSALQLCLKNMPLCGMTSCHVGVTSQSFMTSK